MRRYFTCSAAVLSLVAYASACGDDMLVAPKELPVEAALVVATMNAAAVSDVLEDPFVHLLIRSLNNPAAADAIRASVTAASRGLNAYKPVSARLAFASARSEIEVYADAREADPNDVLTLAALRLIVGLAEKLSVQDTEDGPIGQPEDRSIPERIRQER